MRLINNGMFRSCVLLYCFQIGLSALAIADSGGSGGSSSMCLTALTGDVTASGPGSATATISSRAVTGDKIELGTISGDNLGGSIFINTSGRLSLTNYVPNSPDSIVIVSSANGGVDRAIHMGTDNNGTGKSTGRVVIQADNEANNKGETLFLQPDGSRTDLSNGRLVVNYQDNSVQWGLQVTSLPTCNAGGLGKVVLYHKTNTDSFCACERSGVAIYAWSPLAASTGDCN